MELSDFLEFVGNDFQTVTIDGKASTIDKLVSKRIPLYAKLDRSSMSGSYLIVNRNPSGFDQDLLYFYIYIHNKQFYIDQYKVVWNTMGDRFQEYASDKYYMFADLLNKYYTKHGIDITLNHDFINALCSSIVNEKNNRKDYQANMLLGSFVQRMANN